MSLGKNMMKVVGFVLLPTLSFATGNVEIVGKALNGEYVLSPSCSVSDPEYPKCLEVVGRFTVFQVNETKWKRVASTICMESSTADGKQELRCIQDGKSPFSGTLWDKRKVKGRCADGVPQFSYTCRENCTMVPRVMTQDYWEC